MIRKGWIASAAAVLITAGTFAIATSAQAKPLTPAAPSPAAVTDVRCDRPSTNALGFTPALTLVNQPTVIQRTTAYRACVSSATTNINSGYEFGSFSFGDDCTMVLLNGSATYTITWNNNATTTFTAAKTVTLSGTTLTVVFNGTVTSGLFTGSTVKQVFTANTPELVQCLTANGKLPFILSDVSLNIFH